MIAANALWVVDSLLALALDWFTPTTAGQILIAVQAVLVAGLAALQYVGLRRYRSTVEPLQLSERRLAEHLEADRVGVAALLAQHARAAVDALELEAQGLVGRQRALRAHAHPARPEVDRPPLDRRSAAAVQRARHLDLDPG